MTVIECHWGVSQSYAFCFICSVIYVGCLYLLVPDTIRKLSRENPSHIKHRLIAATIAKVIIFTITIYFVPIQDCLRLSFLQAFGFAVNKNIILGLFVTACLMSIFYLGELTGNILVFIHRRYYTLNAKMSWEKAIKPVPLSQIFKGELHRILDDVNENPIMAIRNVIFAPISEELVFRGVIVTVIYISYINLEQTQDPHMAAYQAVWASIGWFGIAHLHHMLEKIRSGETFMNAFKVSSIQLIYTSIFAYIAAILFVRTGNVYAPILSHMICNFLGLPDMGFMQPPPNHYVRMGCNYPFRYLLLVLHILGLVLFSFLLFPCTEFFAQQSHFYQNHQSINE